MAQYVHHSFIKPATCASLCLFGISHQPASPPAFVVGGECRIEHTSNSGPSGRPDVAIQWKNMICCATEVKTEKVCRVGTPQMDMLDQLGNQWTDWPQWEDGRVPLADVYAILCAGKELQIEEMTGGSDGRCSGAAQGSGWKERLKQTLKPWQVRVIGTVYQVRSLLSLSLHWVLAQLAPGVAPAIDQGLPTFNPNT